MKNNKYRNIFLFVSYVLICGFLWWSSKTLYQTGYMDGVKYMNNQDYPNFCQLTCLLNKLHGCEGQCGAKICSEWLKDVDLDEVGRCGAYTD